MIFMRLPQRVSASCCPSCRSERRNGAPVYRNGAYTLSRERAGELGWLIADTRPLFGVMTDSLSVPGHGWQRFEGQGTPYVTWVTIEEGVRSLKIQGNLKFPNSLELYSQALDLAFNWEYRQVDEELVNTLKSNRAECYLRRGE